MFKKIVLTFIVTFLFFCTSSFYSSNASASGAGIIRTDWYYVSKSPAGLKQGTKKLYYVSGVASRNGETVSQAIGKEKTNSISSSVGWGLSRTIQSEVGYSFGTTKTKGIQHTSGPLRKGEYAKFYENKAYQTTKVKLQRRFDNRGQCVLETKYVYTYKEQIPQITIKYYKKDKKGKETCR
jgi:hypothetical protein